MSLKGKKIGIAFTGSFCTFNNAFNELKKLVKEKTLIYPIFSFNTQTVKSRFGEFKKYVKEVESITKNKAIVEDTLFFFFVLLFNFPAGFPGSGCFLVFSDLCLFTGLTVFTISAFFLTSFFFFISYSIVYNFQ